MIQVSRSRFARQHDSHAGVFGVGAVGVLELRIGNDCRCRRRDGRAGDAGRGRRHHGGFASSELRRIETKFDHERITGASDRAGAGFHTIGPAKQRRGHIADKRSVGRAKRVLDRSGWILQEACDRNERFGVAAGNRQRQLADPIGIDDRFADRDALSGQSFADRRQRTSRVGVHARTGEQTRLALTDIPFGNQRIVIRCQHAAVRIDQFDDRIQLRPGAVDVQPNFGAAGTDERIDVQVAASADRAIGDEAETSVFVAGLLVGCQFAQKLRLAGDRIGIDEAGADRFFFGDRDNVSVAGSFADDDAIPQPGLRRGTGYQRGSAASNSRKLVTVAMSTSDRSTMRMRSSHRRSVAVPKDRVGCLRQALRSMTPGTETFAFLQQWRSANR